MIKTYLLTTAFLLIFIYSINSQTVKVPSTADAWDTVGAIMVYETYKGKECLLIKSGAIIVKGANLRDGIIEADISFTQKHSFPGFALRLATPTSKFAG